jgi:hypothetical protein
MSENFRLFRAKTSKKGYNRERQMQGSFLALLCDYFLSKWRTVLRPI